ncbi:MAG: LamG domain-containing protein [Anaerolineales bacterium]|nr:LamG domain-containing protein [Anaerolineales bacterium]
MALLLNGANQYAQIMEGLFSTEPVLCMAWFKSSSQTANQRILTIFNSSNNRGFAMGIDGAGGDRVNALKSSSTGAQDQANSSAAYVANQWQLGMAEFLSSTSRNAFLNGASKGVNTTSVGAASPNRTYIGRGSSADFFVGQLAELAIWFGEIPSDDQKMAMYMDQLSPLFFPQGLQHYWPLIDSYADVIGGKFIDPIGSPTFVEHPEIHRPRRLAARITGL